MLHKDREIPYLYKKSNDQDVDILILLHGYGSNEEDLFSFHNLLPIDFEIFSLRAPHNLMFGGYSWYDIHFNNDRKFIDENQAYDSLNMIKKFIFSLKDKSRYKSSKIWIMGFSQGAILSLACAVNFPEMVNNIIALSGFLEPNLLKNIKNKSDYSHLRVFASHGLRDEVIPFFLAKNLSLELNKYGIQCEFKSYPFDGHTVSSQNFQDILKFINNIK